ncbi:membrane protein [Pseudomonas oryzihabitans]|nr:membrane protein [Pseudomonas psychrotolerans]KTT43797.1 membrane protein [Pseudomonas psychrotolerans]KTT64533.1 membrane protein [Pseudomonas psychrotolerans]
MAEVAQRAQQQQVKEQTFIGSVLTFPFHFLGVMFASLFGAVLIDWLCLYFLWPEAGWHHAKAMLDHELAWLSQGFLSSVVVQEPGRTATWLVQLLYDWLFVKTGVIQWLTGMQQVAAAGPRGGLDLRYLAAQSITTVQTYGLSALFTILVFCVRLVILTLAVPLFAMAALVGFIDGLVRRDIRKFGAGRESSYFYHKARSTLLPLALLPWSLYLALPISVSPLLVLLPCAALLALAVNLTTASFKKYL